MIEEYARLLQKHGLKVILSGAVSNKMQDIFNDKTNINDRRVNVEKVFREQLIDVLSNRRKVMTTPCSSLAQLEDLMQIVCGTEKPLRHFHCLIFFDDTKVSTVLEIAGMEEGRIQWIQAFARDQTGILRFNDSKWVRQLATQVQISKALLGELNEQ